MDVFSFLTACSRPKAMFKGYVRPRVLATDRAGMRNAAKKDALANGCTKEVLNPRGRFEQLRFGRANKRMDLERASLFVSPHVLLSEYSYPSAVVLFLHLKLDLALLFLLMFCVSG
jgi:hypothetical protein